MYIEHILTTKNYKQLE